MIRASKPSMGEDSYRSSAFPWGIPSTWGTSTRTMSPSSLLAAQWAQVAPTLPAPMMLIFALFILVLSFAGSMGDYRQSEPLCNAVPVRSRSTDAKANPDQARQAAGGRSRAVTRVGIVARGEGKL